MIYEARFRDSNPSQVVNDLIRKHCIEGLYYSQKIKISINYRYTKGQPPIHSIKGYNGHMLESRPDRLIHQRGDFYYPFVDIDSVLFQLFKKKDL